MKVKIKLNLRFDKEMIIMSVLAFIFAITAIEILFRSNEEPPPIPVLGLSEEFCPHPDYFEGQRDDPGFRMQANYIRRYTDKKKEKVFILGGSATEAYYLRESERWPFFLHDLFLETQQEYAFINNAHSGSTSFQHVKDIKAIRDSFPEVEKFIVAVGAADMLFAISGRDYSDLGGSILQNSAIFRDRSLIVEVEERPTQSRHTDYSPLGYSKRRQSRRQGPFRSELPDLESELDDFADNIRDMVKFARKNNKRIMFITEPFYWKEGLTDQEKQKLWTGAYFKDDGFKPTFYYSAEALSKAMKMFNSTLLETCKEENVYCYDLASDLEPNSESFFDGYHMGEEGHFRASNLIFQNMQSWMKEPPQ